MTNIRIGSKEKIHFIGIGGIGMSGLAQVMHRMGFKVIVYLIILTVLVYFSMKKIWSRIESEV